MRNKYNAIQIIAKVYKLTLKAVPLSGVLGVINYLAQGLFPAFTLLILAQLFEAANSLKEGVDTLSKMVFYGILFVSAYAIVYILQFVSSISINAGIFERCTSFYKLKLSEKTARLPLILFENADVLNLQNRARACINDENLSVIYMSSAVFITSGISIISSITVLATYNTWFVPISLLSVIPYFIVRTVRGKEFYKLKKAQVKKERRLGYLWGLFNNKQTVKEMRVIGFDEYLSSKWIETRNEVNEELWQQSVKDGKSLLICDTIKIVGYGASILLSLFLVMNSKISIGVFGACIAAFKAMQEAAKSFLIDLGNMPEKIAFANEYFEFLDLSEDLNGQEKIKGLESKISLEGISFTYPNSNKYALKDVSLTINKGEKVVILGENGSGKTTLSKLLVGLYPPSNGKVLYDNISLDSIDKNSLYTYISVVPQNFVSYRLSLRENIAISDLSHINDDLQIKNSLKLSGLESIIDEFGNLEEQLGREFGGTELSGGQWQKLAIARSLFKSSELILLDEPTSALDPLIETEILTKFIDIAKEKTAIIISHRVGLCKLADKIVVMRDGKICEIGTHETLIKNNGEYTRLYISQERWYREECMI